MIDINPEFIILNNIDSDFHTSIRPLIEFRYDTSIYHTDIQSLFYRKLKNEDLYRIKGQGYNLKFNPIERALAPKIHRGHFKKLLISN